MEDQGYMELSLNEIVSNNAQKYNINFIITSTLVKNHFYYISISNNFLCKISIHGIIDNHDAEICVKTRLKDFQSSCNNKVEIYLTTISRDLT